MPAPTMLYVMPDNFTPAHRAQLVKSNKKLEQILGVTPSVVPIAPSKKQHRSTKSVSSLIERKPSTTSGRERGRLASIWPLKIAASDDTSSTEESTKPLTRVSTDSTSTSTSSSSTSSSPISVSSSESESENLSPSLPYHRDLTPRKRRQQQHRPPMLNLSHSGAIFPPLMEEETLSPILDISPNPAPRSAVVDRVDIDASPLSPTFHVELSSSSSSSTRKEEDDVLRDILNTSTLKKSKMTRLAKRFGTQPPLELVFPPSPTSQSRHDPKRYTLGLPPPLIRGDKPEQQQQEEEEDSENVLMWEKKPRTSSSSSEGNYNKYGKVIQVIWNDVSDETGRNAVMSALRELRSDY